MDGPFKHFIQHFVKRGALVPRFPLTRTLGPLGVTAAADIVADVRAARLALEGRRTTYGRLDEGDE